MTGLPECIETSASSVIYQHPRAPPPMARPSRVTGAASKGLRVCMTRRFWVFVVSLQRRWSLRCGQHLTLELGPKVFYKYLNGVFSLTFPSFCACVPSRRPDLITSSTNWSLTMHQRPLKKSHLSPELGFFFARTRLSRLSSSHQPRESGLSCHQRNTPKARNLVSSSLI